VHQLADEDVVQVGADGVGFTLRLKGGSVYNILQARCTYWWTIRGCRWGLVGWGQGWSLLLVV
jgi:hypothetical protein